VCGGVVFGGFTVKNHTPNTFRLSSYPFSKENPQVVKVYLGIFFIICFLNEVFEGADSYDPKG